MHRREVHACIRVLRRRQRRLNKPRSKQIEPVSPLGSCGEPMSKPKRWCPVVLPSTDVRFQMGTVEQGACSGQGVWRPQHVDESGGTSLSGKRADVLRACAHGVEQTAGTRLAVGCHPSADATIHTSPGPNTVQWLLGIGRRRRMQSCGNATRSRATGDARRFSCAGRRSGHRGGPERTRACV